MTGASRLSVIYLTNLANTVKLFQSACAKYSAAAVSVLPSVNPRSNIPNRQLADDKGMENDCRSTAFLAFRQLHFYSNLQNSSMIDVAEKDMTEDSSILPMDQSTYDIGTVELIATELDERMMKGITGLFPQSPWSNNQLTVVTISLRTELDMGEWSAEIEAERDSLLDSFIISSAAICQALRSSGFWADFIDPSSGKPYLSTTPSTSVLFETDYEVIRLSGGRLTINDLGCCRVVSHKLWGTHAYIGFLFTDAPREHPILIQMKR